MRWSFDLTGAEPIIRDCAVYDAAALANGELLMMGTHKNSAADGGISLITAYNGTAASSAIDAVGILTESTYASSNAPDRVVDDTSGVYLGKVIINPFAVYMAQVDGSTGDDIAVESSSTTILIKETLSTIGADDLDGYWVLFTNCASAGLDGQLRMVTGNDTDDFDIPALPSTPTTSDNYIFANPAFSYACNLNAEATMLTSDKTLDAPEGATNLRVINSYAKSASTPMVPLLSYVSPAGSSSLGSGAKLYSEIMMKDHAFGVQEA